MERVLEDTNIETKKRFERNGLFKPQGQVIDRVRIKNKNVEYVKDNYYRILFFPNQLVFHLDYFFTSSVLCISSFPNESMLANNLYAPDTPAGSSLKKLSPV